MVRTIQKVFISLILGLVVVSQAGYGAEARIIRADGGYLYGGAKHHGYFAHAAVDVIYDFLVDASFFGDSLPKKAADDGTAAAGKINHLLYTAGLLYRVWTEPDLEIFLGAGALGLSRKETGSGDLKGLGVYGKFGFVFWPLPELTLSVDFSLAPKAKLDSDSGSIFTSRATVAYQIWNGLQLQATLKNYSYSASNPGRGLLVGAGVGFVF